jgi:tRNA pseudouridine55 synthase
VSSDKDYEATIRFGVSTDSYDITGNETSRSERVPARDAVEAALTSLRGEYLQVPPAFSAKKVAGERAYALARRDEAVTLQPVPVRVTRADLVEFSGASARIHITCSAGFYVRTFAHSLGELVATGACLEALRRTRSGEFTIHQAVELEDVRQSSVAVTERWIPLDRLLPSIPSVRLGDEGRKRVAHGQMLDASHVLDTGSASRSPGAWTRLIDEEGQLVALGTVDESGEFLHPAVVLI